MVGELPNRTHPPADVRRQLRQEVSFGCPVNGCASPYLTWHHFDPPWHVKPHHEPDGMVALCLPHHKEADAGAWTTEQLKQLKAAPFLSVAGGLPRGRFNWRRERLVLLAGGLWCVKCDVLVTAGGEDLIWLSRDEDRYELLNLRLRGADGGLLFEMIDNDWVFHLAPEDVECRPAGNSLLLRAPAKGARLTIKFSNESAEQFRRRVERLSLRSTAAAVRDLTKRLKAREEAPEPGQAMATQMIQSIAEEADENAARMYERLRPHIPDGDVTLCRLTARFLYPDDVRLFEDKTVLPRNNVFQGGSMIHAGVGISL